MQIPDTFRELLSTCGSASGHELRSPWETAVKLLSHTVPVKHGYFPSKLYFIHVSLYLSLDLHGPTSRVSLLGMQTKEFWAFKAEDSADPKTLPLCQEASGVGLHQPLGQPPHQLKTLTTLLWFCIQVTRDP